MFRLIGKPLFLEPVDEAARQVRGSWSFSTGSSVKPSQNMIRCAEPKAKYHAWKTFD